MEIPRITKETIEEHLEALKNQKNQKTLNLKVMIFLAKC
jgi:hypothetical protein